MTAPKKDRERNKTQDPNLDPSCMEMVVGSYRCGLPRKIHISCGCHLRRSSYELTEGKDFAKAYFKSYANRDQAIADGWKLIDGKWSCRLCNDERKQIFKDSERCQTKQQ